MVALEASDDRVSLPGGEPLAPGMVQGQDAAHLPGHRVDVTGAGTSLCIDAITVPSASWLSSTPA